MTDYEPGILSQTDDNGLWSYVIDLAVDVRTYTFNWIVCILSAEIDQNYSEATLEKLILARV